MAALRRPRRATARPTLAVTGVHAVPVWVKVSDTPEVTGVKTVIEEERAEGLLRLEPDALALEVEIVQSTTVTGGMGTKVETENLGTRELRIPFSGLVSVRFSGRWWRPRIHVQTNRLGMLEGLTGSRQGAVKLRVSPRHWKAARALVNEVDFVSADIALEEASRPILENPDKLS